jgi:hypothetical protein
LGAGLEALGPCSGQASAAMRGQEEEETYEGFLAALGMTAGAEVGAMWPDQAAGSFGGRGVDDFANDFFGRFFVLGKDKKPGGAHLV